MPPPTFEPVIENGHLGVIHGHLGSVKITSHGNLGPCDFYAWKIIVFLKLLRPDYYITLARVLWCPYRPCLTHFSSNIFSLNKL